MAYITGNTSTLVWRQNTNQVVDQECHIAMYRRLVQFGSGRPDIGAVTYVGAGTGLIDDLDVGGVGAVGETWTIEFVSSTVFTVSGSITGLVVDGSRYTRENTSLATQVTSVSGVNLVTVTDEGDTTVLGDILWHEGFTTAANNGTFTVLTAPGNTTYTTNEALVNEAVPLGASSRVVGRRGAATDIAAAIIPNSISATALNLTTLGLTVGDWVKLAGFVTAANNGWCRISVIAASLLTFDIVPTGWAAEAAPAGSVDIYMGPTTGTISTNYTTTGDPISSLISFAVTAPVETIAAQASATDIIAAIGPTSVSSTVLDLTTLGLSVGDWVKFTGFTTAANNDWCRISIIAANLLTFDSVPPGWSAETPAGSIGIYTGNPFIAKDKWTFDTTTNAVPASDRWVLDRWSPFTQSQVGSGGGVDVYAIYNDEITVGTKGSLIWHGTGSGTDAIYAGISILDVPASQMWNWRLQGYTGFSPSTNWVAQPGVTTAESYVAHVAGTGQDEEYWFVLNSRRYVAVWDAQASMNSLYQGFILPYATPSEYPYPMLICGASSSAFAFNLATSKANGIVLGGSNTGYFRKPGGIWSIVGAQSATGTSCFPMNATLDLGRSALAWTLHENLDSGDHWMVPSVYMSGAVSSSNLIDFDVYGASDGCFLITGTNQAAQTIITVAAQDYLVCSNFNRVERDDFWALRLA